MIIILNGITGSGKSTLGRYIAKSLKYNFIDLDHYIEMNQASSISSIFESKGESYFRKKESECLTDILSSNPQNLLLSLGGGTFKNNNNVELCLSKGLVIWIDMPIAILMLRLHNLETRPLLKNSSNLQETLQQMIDERNPNYQKSHIKITFDKNYPTQYMAKELLNSINNYLRNNKNMQSLYSQSTNFYLSNGEI